MKICVFVYVSAHVYLCMHVWPTHMCVCMSQSHDWQKHEAMEIYQEEKKEENIINSYTQMLKTGGPAQRNTCSQRHLDSVRGFAAFYVLFTAAGLPTGHRHNPDAHIKHIT